MGRLFFTNSLTIGYSNYDNEHFLDILNAVNQWILATFGWLFTWSSFLFLLLLTIIYGSPIGKSKIGGADAKPLLTRWKWFAIALCTTVATGILFLGTAEPLYHLHTPPDGVGLAPNSEAAATFAMSTMFMHWSFTPYGIYTIAGLAFALTYYNLKQPFSISTLLHPLLGDGADKIGDVLDVVCLYALICGMAASLGTGIFAITGGLDLALGIEKSNLLLGLVGFAIVATFILSAVSGLQKGITVLSNWNARGFFVLAVVLFLLGPTFILLELGWKGLMDYLINFIPRSTNIGSGLPDAWLNNWTIFYYANWFAWAPVASLFLGRLAVGYTVRDFIKFNLIFPAVFTWCWMMVFGGLALQMDMAGDGFLQNILKTQGEQNVMFAIFDQLPFGQIISIATLVMVFISYVTAADSNISAMSGISTRGINPDNPEAPIWIKIVWGAVIGAISLVMITTAGLDGVRLLSVLGGFPALFIIVGVAIGLVRLVLVK